MSCVIALLLTTRYVAAEETSGSQARPSLKQVVASILTTATQPVARSENSPTSGSQGQSKTERVKAEPTKTPMPMPEWAGAKLTPAEVELHRGEPGVVRLYWTTESEQSSFGFNVMRGDNQEGNNFSVVNKKVILG